MKRNLLRMTALIMLLLALVAMAFAQVSITTLSPVRAASNVAVNTNITVTFGGTMNTSTETAANIRVHGSISGEHAGSITLNGATGFTFDPTADFRAGERVFVDLSYRIKNAGGDSMTAGYHYDFGTAVSKGSGRFAQLSATTLASAPQKAVMGDIDGDGDMDIVVAHFGTTTLSVGTNNGSGSYTWTTIAGAGYARTLALADVDQDGDLDITVAGYSFWVFKNNASGSFTQTQSLSLGVYAYDLTVGDFDGDGDLDAATVGYYSLTNQANILTNNGTGTFSNSTVAFPTNVYPGAIAVIDKDGDGDLDLVAAFGESNAIAFLTNNGSGTFTSATQTVGSGGYSRPRGIVVGDLDGDGDQDLALNYWSSTTNSVLKNDGAGTFTESATTSPAYYSYSIAGGDFDNDGDIDLAHGYYNANALYLQKNNGTGGFGASSSLATGGQTYALMASDFDGDGDVDLIDINQTEGNIVIYENAGVVTATSSMTNFASAPTVPSAIQSYTVSATALRNNLTIVPPSKFEISLTGGEEFAPQNPITLTHTGGTIASTTIYVRFTPDAEQSVSDSIANSSIGGVAAYTVVHGSGLASEPTTGASGITFSNVGTLSMQIDWTNGDGANRVVVVKAVSGLSTPPADGTTYSANAWYGKGTAVESGAYAVYNGTGTSVTVTGLSAGTTYYVSVFEVNGSAGTENYLTGSYPEALQTMASFAVSNSAGNALKQSGYNQSLAIPASSVFDNTAGFTYEMWVYSNYANSGYIFYNDNYGAGRTNYAWFASGGLIYWAVGNGNGGVYRTFHSAPITAAHWHHLAFTYESSTGLAKIYVDGKFDNDTTTATPQSAADTPMQLFGQSGNYNSVSGMIDEARIWNIARTELQIREGMNHTLGGAQNGLVGYWQFTEGTGATVEDLVGGNTMALNNYTFDQYTNWVHSTVPVGGGSSVSAAAITSEQTTLGNAMIAPIDPFDNAVDVTAAEVIASPNLFPAGSPNYQPGTYWIVNTFGTPGTFSTNLTFTVPSGFVLNGYAANSNFKLYRRNAADTTAWALAADTALSLNSSSISFTGITALGQFIIGTNIALTLTPSPANGAPAAAAATDITFTANQPLNAATVIAGNMEVRGSRSGIHAGSVTVLDDTTFTFNPTNDFTPGEEVTVMVNKQAQSQNGFLLTKGFHSSFRVASAPASASFARRTPSVATVTAPTQTISADFNHDGYADVAVIGNAQSISIHLNDGSGTLGAAASIALLNYPNSVTPVDYDNDGDIDLVVTYGSSSYFTFLNNDGNGEFSVASNMSLPSSTWAYGLAFGDVDGDGDLDIVPAFRSYYFTWFRNDGAGVYTYVNSTFFTGVSQFSSVALQDVDHDGDLDAVETDGGGTLYVFKNDGVGNFTLTQTLGGANAGYSMEAGDIDGDGDIDIVQSSYWGTFISVSRNDGTGTFARDPSINTTYRPYQITLADLDGDGDLDIAAVLSDAYHEAYDMLINDGSGLFTQHITDSGMWSGQYDNAGVAVDLNNDGDVDFVFGSRNASSLKTLMNVPHVVLAGSVTGFGDVVRNAPSAIQSYQVYAKGLASNLLLRAPAGFSLSLTGEGYFNPADSLELPPINHLVDTTTIFVRFDPTSVGAYSGNIVHLAAEADTNLVALSGTGVAPVLSFSSPTLAFGNLRITHTRRDSVWIRNSGTAILNITGIVSSDYTLSAGATSTSISPGDSTQLYVDFSPADSGARAAAIVVTNDADSQSDTLFAFGNGIAPIFDLSVSGSTFPETPVGGVDSTVVMLRNPGTDTLFLQSILLGSPEYEASPDSVDILAGDSAQIVIRFRPSAEGDRSSYLTFYHDLGGLQIPLTASAINGISVNDTCVVEGNSGSTMVRFTVHLTLPVNVFTSMNYVTGDQTALAGADYTPATGQILFPPGSQTQIVSVAVRGERYYESNESLKLIVDNPVNAKFVDSVGIGTILNDDTPLASAAALATHDINNDQGGRLRLQWNRAPLDTVDVDPQIVTYGVWRRIPPAANTSVQNTLTAQTAMNKKNVAAFVQSVQNDTLGTLYDFLGTVPAVQSPEYRFEATTLGDSSASGVPLTSYLITAHTANPTMFAISSAVNGYSVDNIAPSAVSIATADAFDLSHVELRWNRNRVDNDVKAYAVYRSETPGFSITGLTPLTTRRDTAFVDTTVQLNTTYFYRIAAVDVHDNIGTPSTAASVAVPLAMSLSSFSAATTRNGGVALEWTTVSEEGTVGFDVERRSMEGDDQVWQKVGFVKGSGNSSVERHYAFTERLSAAGRYAYRLKEWDRIGKFSLSFAQEVDFTVPREFALAQNFPNPFNPTTTIEFTVADDVHASLKIYNMLGQEVATLFDGEAAAGMYHRVTFDAKPFASGIYFSRLEAAGKQQMRRMVLLK